MKDPELTWESTLISRVEKGTNRDSSSEQFTSEKKYEDRGKI